MPTIIELSFCVITIIQADIAEVVVGEGVIVDVDMINEFDQVLSANMSELYSILVNRENSYSYTDEAKVEIFKLTKIKAVAVVSYVHKFNLSLQTMFLMFLMFSELKWKVKVFNDKSTALAWLQNLEL